MNSQYVGNVGFLLVFAIGKIMENHADNIGSLYIRK